LSGFVFVFATCDTKGAEATYLAEGLRARGVAVRLIDTGGRADPEVPVDVTRAEVFRAAGTTVAEIDERRDRGFAVDAAARGAVALARACWERGELAGVIGLGGSAGTTIGTAAMRALPYYDDSYGVNSANMWDPLTGEIDHEAARLARDRFDLRHVFEENWSTLGPELVGKLHVYVGRMDHYYLEGGVYRFEEFLESTEAPYYDGEFGYGPRGGHGWPPFEGTELLETMARRMETHATDG